MTLLHNLILSKIFGGSGGGGGSITVDSTLSISSTNPVQNKVVTGAFNSAAKLLAAKADKMEFVDVLSATPAIRVQDNKFYVCDETQKSLTIPVIDAGLTGPGQTSDPPSFIVRFNSGATPTELTITDQIVMPDGFEVEANKTYEINVARWYALVSEWPYTAGGDEGDILTPVSWIQAQGSPIDTGITVNNNVLLQMSIKRNGPNTGRVAAEFSDGTTFITKVNDSYTNGSKAFGEEYTTFVREGTQKIFVIDGVNHRVQWDKDARYFTATQFVQATQSMKVGIRSTPYVYWVKGFEDDVLVHHLLPYLKNGKPGLYDILTDEFHTVAEGGTDWTYG